MQDYVQKFCANSTSFHMWELNIHDFWYFWGGILESIVRGSCGVKSIRDCAYTYKKGKPASCWKMGFIKKSIGNEMNCGWLVGEMKGVSNKEGKNFFVIICWCEVLEWKKEGRKEEEESILYLFLFAYSTLINLFLSPILFSS